jgi:hypothetical protein
VLPNFFVIGAANSGTTSLYHYLGLHAQIHVSATKEPAYFCRELDGPWRLGRVATRAEYEALFESAAPMRGDCTPAYSQHPWRSGVPERIHELIPTARFIYLVRDPVERVLAQVQHAQAAGQEQPNPLRVVLGEIDDPLRNRYLIPSLYATQVQRYHDVFPSERMLVVDSADLKSARATTLRRIFRFLGVDEVVASADFSAELNRGEAKRLPSRRYARLRESSLGRAWRRLPGRVRVPVGRRVMRGFTAPAERPNLEDDLRLALGDIFRPEAERLRALTGLSFASWSL